jgi:hypothetical protein
MTIVKSERNRFAEVETTSRATAGWPLIARWQKAVRREFEGLE